MSYLQNPDRLEGFGPTLRASPSLAIVIPCYNEESALPALLDRLSAVSEDLIQTGRIAEPAEIILIDDGSADRTWELICESRQSYRVKGVRLSRNHGHQRALLAGLMQADADVVVSMDADLQDDPNAIGSMIDAYRKGAEIVFGVRASRKTDTAFKRCTAGAYYALLSRLGVDLIPDHADFRLMSRKALSTLSRFDETNLFLRGMVRQIGFHSEIVTYDRAPRCAGESKYPLGKMLALAIDGVTSFSVQPLRMITLAGFAIAAVALLYMCYSLVSWLMGGTVVGWASTVMPIYFLGGAHLIALGVIGEYIGKIYQETKRRPRFIVDEVVASGAEPVSTELSNALPSLKVVRK